MNLPLLRKQDTWDPFGQHPDFHEEMEQLFNNIGRRRLPALINVTQETKSIPIDIHDSDEEIVIKAAMPGVCKDNISVTADGWLLTIRAERIKEEEVKEEHIYCREMAYGMFQRQLELPDVVKTEAIQASYENGILELKMPKRDQDKRRQVKIDVK